LTGLRPQRNTEYRGILTGSDEELRKLAGQNLLRVMRRVEAIAATLQRESPPSSAIIEELDPQDDALEDR
jgi:hypothetical protein